ncbi:MAG: signal peptide peptidase SppA [Balneolaceae bacterium]|nr:MAG: signal peptide peptidase SppA [Balneolaceae bacterium]
MQFFKTFFASLLGTILGILLLVIILFAAVVSSSSEPEPFIRANTVLTITLSGDIPFRAPDDPFQELFNPGAGTPVSVLSLQNNLRKAAADDNIAGVWITANNVLASWANLQDVYDALGEYKESGKFLYFSTDDIGMNEKAYFLATQADSIFYTPESVFNLTGFVAQITMYRGLLDEIGIEPENLHSGRYKSVIEPFMLRTISDEYRVQIEHILDSYSTTFVNAVSKKTGKTADEVNDLINTPPIQRVKFAYENGLIDVIAYHDEVIDFIKERIELDEDQTLRTVSHRRYSRVSDKRAGLETTDTSDKIAVIYASGTIMPQIADSPFGQSGNITVRNFRNQINSALEDDDVKSIVIYINSPGGAATSSDMLWREVKRASDKKPVVAHMGTVAASGGYYMAMGADSVVAQHNTITGSIGVALNIFNAYELLTEKLGLGFDTIKSHEFADIFDLTRPLTSLEREIFQRDMDAAYETFLNVVANNRGMTRDEVHEVAQGRVYTGWRALELGLIDEIGDLDRSLEIAAEMAGITEFTIDTYPKREDLFQALFGAADTKMRSIMFGWIPESLRAEAETAHMMTSHQDVRTWMVLPFNIDTR